MVYTRSQLKEMPADDLVEKYLNLQTTETSIEKLTVEMKGMKEFFEAKFDDMTKQFNERMDYLQSEVNVTKNANMLLQQRCFQLEQRSHNLECYSRRECLEVRGVPDDIEHSNILTFIKPIFKEIGCEVTSDDQIQACHRLNGKKDVIIKFTYRDQRNAILRNRKQLKEKDLSEVTPEHPNTQIFINESLSPYSKRLVGIANVLKRRGLIHSFWTINGNIRFKYGEHDTQFESIFHESHYTDIFHDLNLANIFVR